MEAEDVRKCPVLPVTAMAMEHNGGNGVDREGGPVIDKQEEDNKFGLVYKF
jgi:hypothetical protein